MQDKKCVSKEESIKINKSLKYSVLDGSFYSMMVGFGESFFIAFATFLRATTTELGILGSLPQVLGSFCQILSNKLQKLFKTRKQFVLTGVFIQALIFIFVALAFFLGKFKVIYLIFFVCFYWVIGSLVAPVWSSWMGDLVEEKIRGKYFGKRNMITGFSTLLSMIVAGYVLQEFTNAEIAFYGFLAVFIIALITRLISFFYLTLQHEPEYHPETEERINLLDFIKKARFGNFEMFVLYIAFINIAVFISGPFFAAYILYDLKLSYLQYTIILASSLIVKNLFMPIWGKASDRFGTKKVLTLSSYLISLVPILWLFSSNFFYLLVIQFYNGFVWAGFELSAFNFIFDTTAPRKRITSIGYYNFLNGIGIFIGGILGSILVKFHLIFWSAYLFTFLLSGILRLGLAAIFTPRLKEARPVEQISYRRLFTHVLTDIPGPRSIYMSMPFRKNKGRNCQEDVSEWD